MIFSNTETFRQALSSADIRQSELERLARESDMLFVRSLDQLAEYVAGARGHQLSAWEALSAYGRDALLEAVTEGSVLLSDFPTAAGRVLKQRREQLGLTIAQAARRAGLTETRVSEAENSRRLSILDYERIGRSLGLDERYISFRGEPVGNDRLAVRLRTMGDEFSFMNESAVSAIAEASWVAMTQIRLEKELDIQTNEVGISPTSNYGAPGYPAYKQGYFLAYDARLKLNLDTDPILSLRELCEERLGIPLIQAELGDNIAGVTVETSGRRAIVINLVGKNQHVYIRRSTIAHELGHLLYDVSQRLNELRVDDYDELEKAADQIPDVVEQRANAFSVEFIAPQKAVLRYKDENDPVGVIMDTFGLSYTAARYQLWNALDQSVPIDTLVSVRRHPNVEWEAREAYTVDFHPVHNLPASRAGKFSAVVLKAAQENVISWQTAAQYLVCDEYELQRAASQIRELFPGVWN